MVLIDSGSTHNFISHEIAKKLNFNPSAVEPFSVRVAKVNLDAVKRIRRQGGSCYAVQIEEINLKSEADIGKLHPKIKQVLIQLPHIL